MMDLSHLLQFLAQASAPTADELELLRSQIELLEKAYANLDSTFQRYVNMVQLTLAAAGGIVGAVTVLGTVVSIKSLKDYYDTLQGIGGKVREEVDSAIAVALQRERRRLRQLEAIVDRDLLPERIAIDYVVPIAAPPRRDQGVSFLLETLKRRGFSNIVMRYEPQLQAADNAIACAPFNADIVVLDLNHAGIDQDLAKANAVIAALGEQVTAHRSVVIVYGRARYEGVSTLNSQNKYCSASNGPLTFVARVLEATYVVDALNKVA